MKEGERKARARIMAGDLVRSYDFQGCWDCYVDGRVIELDRESGRMLLEVELDVYQGERMQGDEARPQVAAPLEIFRDWEGRLARLPERRVPIGDAYCKVSCGCGSERINWQRGLGFYCPGCGWWSEAKKRQESGGRRLRYQVRQ